MNYPLISEYIEAIKSAEDNFEELSYIRPVLGDDGLPVMTSGNFAVVFKMKDERDGKLYAVKCFTKEQEGRAEAYREIAKELKDVSSPYLVSIRYLEKELFVDTDQTTDTEFPVLLMDWVDGKTLDKYLRENLDDKYALEMLAYRFSQLAQWLIPQSFAHGDLKPDNILVREDGTLVLVDYDGMYVPAMKGQKARELGSPDFRHPLRTENDFDEHIDDFPLLSILLSIKVVSINPQFWEEFGSSDRLLFSKSDYYDFANSVIFPRLIQLSNNIINQLICSILLSFSSKCLSQSLLLILLSIGDFYEMGDSSREVIHSKIKDVWVDEFGVKYSADKKYLLEGPIEDTIKGSHTWKKGVLTDSYFIQVGTKVICDKAFFDCRGLVSVILSNSIEAIRARAFSNCLRLSSVVLNNGLISIGNEAFSNCKSLSSVTIPSSVKSIGKDAFKGSCINVIYTSNGDKSRVASMLPNYIEIIEELPF